MVAGPGGTTTKISGEGFGSSLAPVPGRPGYFFGLTDRGPNADAPDGNKSEVVLNFTPEIGEFRLVKGKAELVKTVTLKGPRSLGGVPYSGRPPADTKEVIDDVAATNATLSAGKVTPRPVPGDPYGYDSEGLVAMPDGSFWVSDEYGPYITHFDARGFETGRLTPYRNRPVNQDHTIIGYLPPELADRLTNKGMEGLTITPDGKTLVGAMQSALQLPDLGSVKASKVAVTRIITVNLRTFATKQYLYLLDDPATTGDANSEITALSNTKFLVDERDGNFEPNAHKVLYEVNLQGATDVSSLTVVPVQRRRLRHRHHLRRSQRGLDGAPEDAARHRQPGHRGDPPGQPEQAAGRAQDRHGDGPRPLTQPGLPGPSTARGAGPWLFTP
jgi:hypothetical protein